MLEGSSYRLRSWIELCLNLKSMRHSFTPLRSVNLPAVGLLRTCCRTAQPAPDVIRGAHHSATSGPRAAAHHHAVRPRPGAERRGRDEPARHLAHGLGIAFPRRLDACSTSCVRCLCADVGRGDTVDAARGHAVPGGTESLRGCYASSPRSRSNSWNSSSSSTGMPRSSASSRLLPAPGPATT